MADYHTNYVNDLVVSTISESIPTLFNVIKKQNKQIYDDLCDNIGDFKNLYNALMFYILADSVIHHKKYGPIYIYPIFLKERISDSDEWISYVDYLDKVLCNYPNIVTDIQYYSFLLIRVNDNIEGVDFTFPIKNSFKGSHWVTK